MKHNLRRFSALLAVFGLLLTLMAGCGRKPGKNEKALAETWGRMLEINEQYYRDLTTAYDLADGFLRDNRWDSLLKARAAAAAAGNHLQQMVLPVFDLSDETVTALWEKGVEVDVVMMEYDGLPATHQGRIQNTILLSSRLEGCIFLTDDVQLLGSWLDCSRNCLQLETRYLWFATNYLLLQFGNEDLWDTWREQFPLTSALAEPWNEDPDDLMAKTDALLDALGEELIRHSGFLGTMEGSKALVQDSLAGGDLSQLAGRLHRIDGVPGYFPCPDWLSLSGWLYLAAEGSGQDQAIITMASDLTRVPSSCCIPCPGIPAEAVEAYADTLAARGLKTLGEWDADKLRYSLIAVDGDSRMLVEWAEDQATIYLSDPVGCLVPVYYLQAQ